MYEAGKVGKEFVSWLEEYLEPDEVHCATGTNYGRFNRAEVEAKLRGQPKLKRFQDCTGEPQSLRGNLSA
jgi:hypothetical protein